MSEIYFFPFGGCWRLFCWRVSNPIPLLFLREMNSQNNATWGIDNRYGGFIVGGSDGGGGGSKDIDKISEMAAISYF